MNNPRMGMMAVHRMFDHTGEDCAEVLINCQVQSAQFYPDRSRTNLDHSLDTRIGVDSSLDRFH